MDGPPTGDIHDPAPDTAAPDTAAPDTAAPDTAAPDTAAPDTAERAEVLDGGAEQGGTDGGDRAGAGPDGGALDSGALDSGAPDSGAPDSGGPDDHGPTGVARGADASPPTIPSPWLEPGEPGPMVTVGFNLHKQAGQGEDADPILRQGADVALIGVLDGMGGAGGTVYRTPDGPRTGAYLASRTARDAAERQVLATMPVDGELDGSALASALHTALADALTGRLRDLHAPPSGLKSRLLRALPTTMAVAVLQRRASAGSWRCHLYSAGDSRVYLLRPDDGAQQLTTDDLRERADAMANLRQDSVVSNALSADTPFTVSYRHIDLDEPFMLLAATDGCFGYLPSPMHFERMVLSTLCGSEDPTAWSGDLQAAISAVAGDDAAMALIGVGADHQRFRTLFAPRLRWLDEHFVGPLDAGDAAVRDAEQRLVAERARRDRQAATLWAEYKVSYASSLQESADSTPTGAPRLATSNGPATSPSSKTDNS